MKVRIILYTGYFQYRDTCITFANSNLYYLKNRQKSKCKNNAIINYQLLLLPGGLDHIIILDIKDHIFFFSTCTRINIRITRVYIYTIIYLWPMLVPWFHHDFIFETIHDSNLACDHVLHSTQVLLSKFQHQSPHMPLYFQIEQTTHHQQ